MQDLLLMFFFSMIIDYLSNPTSKIPLRLDNTLSETGNDFSNDGK